MFQRAKLIVIFIKFIDFYEKNDRKSFKKYRGMMEKQKK
jgi:hypothetical protein